MAQKRDGKTVFFPDPMVLSETDGSRAELRGMRRMRGMRGETLFEKRFFPSRSLFHKLLDAIRLRLQRNQGKSPGGIGSRLIMWEGGAA